jgi:AraC-like DNA-binding protein
MIERDWIEMDAFADASPRPFAAFWQFCAPDDFAAALRSAAVEYMSLAPRPADRLYDASLAVADLGPVTVQHAEDDAHISRAATEPGRHLLLFPTGPVSPGLLVNAHAAGQGDVVVFGPAAELRCIVPAPQAWASVSFDARAGLVDPALLPGDGDSMVARGLGLRASVLVQIASTMAGLARHAPARLAQGTVAAAVTESLAVATTAALVGTPERHRALGHRVRLVAAAEAWLDAMVGQAVYTQELAAALGTAPRTLHDSFSAVYGMSVHLYLRLRRLNLARAALLAGSGGGDLVKAVALGIGFWHLGRFATDYRALFGERPSDTLRASRERMA